MKIEPVQFLLQTSKGPKQRSIEIGSVMGARYASRDREGTRKKLDQLLAKGRSATRTNPSIFRIGRYLLTQSEAFEVQGPLTGGEVEIVAIRSGDEILISVGSDQCDRELDSLFQDKPKQMCPHPLARAAWPYDEVRDHWDELQLFGQVEIGEHVVPVQESIVAALVDLEYLLAMDEVRALPDPAFLYCGAVPFLDAAAETVTRLGLPEETVLGVGDAFLVRLCDPVLNRTIEHRFRAMPLGDDLAERTVKRTLDGQGSQQG
jgi:hypothetical protein